jgi:WD40 repeat protein
MIKILDFLKFILLSAVFLFIMSANVSAIPLFLETEGDFLYSVHDNGTIEKWEKYSGSLERIFPPELDIELWSFGKDETNFYLGTRDGRVIVVDMNGSVLREINTTPDNIISALAVDKELSRLYTGSYDCIIRVYNAKDWSLEKTIDEHKENIDSFYLDDLYLYSGSADGSVKIWDRQNMSLLKTLITATAEGGPQIIEMLVEDNKVYTGHMNGKIRICDLKSGSVIKEIQAHSGVVTRLLTDGQFIYSTGGGTSRGTVKIWTMELDSANKIFETEYTSRVSAIDEDYLYVGVYEGGILVYDKNYLNIVRKLGDFSEVPEMTSSPEQQAEVPSPNPTLLLISVFVSFLIAAVMLETYVGVKKKHGKLTKRGFADTIASLFAIEDVLKIIILSSIIIFAVGTFNTYSVFPHYISNLHAVYYFDMLVRRGAFLPVWFLLLPSVTYWLAKKNSRRIRYSAPIISLLIAAVIYLVAPTI